MAQRPPHDTTHPGYMAVEIGERKLPMLLRRDAAVRQHEDDGKEILRRYQDSSAEIFYWIRMPYDRIRWDSIINLMDEGRKHIPDDVRMWIENFEAFASRKRLDYWEGQLYHDVTTTPQLKHALQNCMDQEFQKTSCLDQDIAIDDAVTRLPEHIQQKINASINRNNSELFAIFITESYLMPQQDFEYHLRRYHALKVVYMHIAFLVPFWRHTDGHSDVSTEIREWLHHDAYRVSVLALRFLYHCRTYDGLTLPELRTMAGWTTGLLFRWGKLSRGIARLFDQLPLFTDEEVETVWNGIMEDEDDDGGGIILEESVRAQNLIQPLQERFWRDFLACWARLRQLRKALDIYTALPVSVDPVFLGEEGEVSRGDAGIALLYDRMRQYVDLREWAFSEDHGAVGAE